VCVCVYSSHMQDLKDVTRDVHYENYRARHIQQQLVQSQKERKSVEFILQSVVMYCQVTRDVSVSLLYDQREQCDVRLVVALASRALQQNHIVHVLCVDSSTLHMYDVAPHAVNIAASSFCYFFRKRKNKHVN